MTNKKYLYRINKIGIIPILKCKKLVHYHGVYEFHFDLIKDDNDDDQFAEQNFELN